jgi:hypothetical protein
MILQRPTTTKEAIGDYSYSVSHFVFQDKFYKNQHFFADGGDLMADHLKCPVLTRLLGNIFSYPYSYCVIELEWRGWFCAVHCSMDIAPGWLRERRSDVGASSRLSWRHVVRDGRAAPRGLQFWETPSVAH